VSRVYVNNCRNSTGPHSPTVSLPYTRTFMALGWVSYSHSSSFDSRNQESSCFHPVIGGAPIGDFGFYIPRFAPRKNSAGRLAGFSGFEHPGSRPAKTVLIDNDVR